MKKTARTRIIIWSVISALLVGALITGIVFVKPLGIYNLIGFSSSSEIKNYSLGNASFDEAKVNSVYVEWKSGIINIESDNVKDISISESAGSENSNNEKMKYNLSSDGTLKIVETNRAVRFFEWFGNNRKSLTIKVPKDKCMNTINIKTASADLECGGINTKNLSCDTASGDITLKNSAVDTMNINGVSGDVNVNCAIKDKVKVNTVSGNSIVKSNCANVELSSVSGDVNGEFGKSLTSLNSNTTSGKIKLAISKDISGFTADYSTTSGNFTSNFSGVTEKNSFKNGDGKAKMNLQTVSGDINIDSTSN